MNRPIKPKRVMARIQRLIDKYENFDGSPDEAEADARPLICMLEYLPRTQWTKKLKKSLKRLVNTPWDSPSLLVIGSLVGRFLASNE